MLESRLSRSDNIFRAALFLSALFHLVVIMYLKLPETIKPMRAKVALSVILTQPQEAEQPTPKPPPPIIVPVTKPPLEVPAPSPEPLAKPEMTKPSTEVVESIPEPKSELTANETPQETSADPVKLSPEIIEAAKVQALLQIDENGEVQRIIWSALPALSNETLLQIEQHLRSKTYMVTGKTYTLYEIVEIPRE